MMPIDRERLKSFFESNLPRIVFESSCLEETLAFASETAGYLKAGDVMALEGDLGAGKTVFVKGLAMGLNLKNPDEVKSPTFVLMHLYPTSIPLYHFDLYRLEKDQDIDSIGLEDFIHDSQAIICIEWAQKAKKYLPLKTYYCRIQSTDETSRKIILEKRGA